MWPPIGMVALDGAMEMETIFAPVTVNGTEVVTDPKVAVIFTKPGAAPNKRPLLEPMVEIVVSEDDQTA